MSFLFVFLAAVAAFSVSALAGGGAGLVMIPVLGLVLPATQVPAALSIGTAVSSASWLAVFRAAVRWDVVIWFVPAALPFVGVGAWLLTLVEPHYLRLALGLFLLANLGCALAPRRAAATTGGRNPTRASLAALGAVAGFTSGFTGAVGVLFNDVYLRWGMGKREIVATRAANEVLLHVLKVALYAAFGLVDGPTLATGGLVAAAAVVASLGAKRILSGLDDAVFRRLNHGAMGVAGAALLWSAGTALAARHDIYLLGRLDAAGVEVGVRWRERSASVEWRGPGGPRFEVAVDVAEVPEHLRPEVASFVAGADRVVIERVRAIGHVHYEVAAYRDGAKRTLRI